MSRLRSSKLIASAAVLAAASAAHAQVFFADSASNYVAGSGTSGFQNPNAALGKPVDETGFGMLTPFNSAFSGDHIVGMGPGDGTITLHLAKTASPTGNSLGIHAATGIIDNDWPNGQAGNPATPFTNPRVANVQVSYDGNTWVDLATHTFESPTNYYAQGITTPGFQSTPGTVEADWAKPFTQPLSAFNGQNWSQMLTTLNGSAGGTWLAISAPVPAGHQLCEALHARQCELSDVRRFGCGKHREHRGERGQHDERQRPDLRIHLRHAGSELRHLPHHFRHQRAGNKSILGFHQPRHTPQSPHRHNWFGCDQRPRLQRRRRQHRR
jgi:hypothetical protein